QFSSGGGGSSHAPSPAASGPRTKNGGFGSMVSNLIQSSTATTLREDFRSGAASWEGLKAGNTDWITEGQAVRPASLRLWEPSESLSNYELEFMGQIEKRSMDWAFRATDVRNYYGTKLVMSRPGGGPNAGLVRFVVLEGRERERVELPLPLSLERGTDYRVR